MRPASISLLACSWAPSSTRGRLAAWWSQRAPRRRSVASHLVLRSLRRASAFQQGLSSFSTLLVRVAGVLTLTDLRLQHRLPQTDPRCIAFLAGHRGGHHPGADARNRHRGAVEWITRTGSAQGAGQTTRSRSKISENPDPLHRQDGTLTEGAITFDRSLGSDGQRSNSPLRFGLVCNEVHRRNRWTGWGQPLDQALWRAHGARPSPSFPRPLGVPREWDASHSTTSGRWRRCWSTDPRGACWSPKARLNRCSHGASRLSRGGRTDPGRTLR